jgi:hypothetical protein
VQEVLHQLPVYYQEQVFRPVQDFEKTFARKLLPQDYYFNPAGWFYFIKSAIAT